MAKGKGKKSISFGSRSLKKYPELPYNEFKQWTIKEMKKAVSDRASAANKRIKRVEEAGLGSPAITAVYNTGGKFSVKGKNTLNELYKEYKRVSNFLNRQDSSLGGARAEVRRVSERLGFTPTKKQLKVIFQAYHKAVKYSPAKVQAYGSERLIQLYGQYMEDVSDELLEGTDFDFESYWQQALDPLEEAYNDRMDSLMQSFHGDIFTF